MRSVAVLLVSVLALAGCGSPPPADRLVVFAAASLTRVFTELNTAAPLNSAAPAADADGPIEFTFAGTADLLAQLTAGARADVFATADAASMEKAAAAGVVTTSVAFATNTLTIAVAPGNPKRINGLRDLSRVTVVACAPQVPCGAALARIEAATGVNLDPASEEASVTDVLNKVVTGQADAGLVYVTDARAAGDHVTAVPLPESSAAPNTYRIAVTRDAADPVRAARFVDLVTGPAGRDVLRRAGFGDP